MENPWRQFSEINPQREDGNTQINKDVLENLISADLNASDYKIVFFIIRKTYGYNKTSDAISASQFKKATNLSERMVKLTIKNLKDRRIIYYEPSSTWVKQGSPINQFLFNKHYDTWLSRRVQNISGGQNRVKKGAKSCQTEVQDISPTIDISTKESSTKEMNTTLQNQRVRNLSPLQTNTKNNIPLKLSQRLFSLILENDPKAKKPNFEKWTGHMEKLMRIDKRTPEEILEVMEWALKDNFWSSNILSTEKLRKQFPQLWIKLNNQRRCKNAKPSNEMFSEKHYEGTPIEQIEWLNEN